MKNCLVFGAGRSGTSLFMSLLRNSNYHMGSNLYGPTKANPTGYFESYEINKINEDILKSVLPNRFFRYEDLLFNIPIIGERIASIRYNQHIPIRNQRWLSQVPLSVEFPTTKDVDKRIGAQTNQSPFCFKDPRFSITLPYWKRHLDVGKVLFVVLFRHPRSTVRSMQKECGSALYLKSKINLSLEYLDDLWVNYYEHILNNHTEQENWLFVHYEQMLDGSALSKIGERTGIVIQDDLIDRSYNRSKDQDHGNERQKVIYDYLCKKSGFFSG